MDAIDSQTWFGLMAAVGGGLLVGVNRERQRAQNPEHEPAGVRSFTVVALTGAVAGLCGGVAVGVAGFGVAALVVASYWHSSRHDPGVTTELALFASLVLGVLCASRPTLGAALFVALALLLQGKTVLHRFTLQVLSEGEVQDALLLAASALIVLPMLPDRAFDPWGVLNPRKLWLFAVLVMAINALGYVALRALGRHRGLPLAGFLGGFISSAATIAGMAHRAREEQAQLGAYAGAALLSCVATVVQMAAILLAVAPALARAIAPALAAAGIVAVVIAGLALWRSHDAGAGEAEAPPGRAFALSQAVLFAAIVAAALLASRLLQSWIGDSGAIAAAAVTGVADVHAASVAVGQLSQGDLAHREALWALALAFTTNSATKAFAATVGPRRYAWRVIAGVAVVDIAFVLGCAAVAL
jgi:uncharacterized membrane protein (DUF4010 family)